MPLRAFFVLVLLAFALASSADPSIAFSTFLGGTGIDYATAIATDRDGNSIVAGVTYSPDFLGLPPQTHPRGFVVKLTPAGALVFKRTIGGSSTDAIYGVATDAAGRIYVTGMTGSDDFPVLNAFRSARMAPSMDAFLARLAPDGTIEYATYFGGSGTDLGLAVAVDDAGNATVTGTTNSSDLPLEKPLQTYTAGGTALGFVTKFNAAGTALVYSTYIGGGGETRVTAVDLDEAGNAYVAGFSSSPQVPLKNAFQSVRLSAANDGFLSKIDPAGALMFSTLFGGTGVDQIAAVDVRNDAVFVGGTTTSTDFPVKNALLATRPSPSVAFAARFDGSGALVYSSYLGGSAGAGPIAIASNARGELTTVMRVSSGDQPVSKPLQTFRAPDDLYILQLDASGTQRLFATYLGVSGVEMPLAMKTDSRGNVVFCGFTDSVSFPMVNALQPALSGAQDGFVMKLSLETAPAKRRSVAH